MWHDLQGKALEEKMLWLAVLRRTIFDYVLYKGAGSRSLDWKHAYQYMFCGVRGGPDSLTFDEICHLFGWEPDYIRRLSTRLTRADVKKMEGGRFKEELFVNKIEDLVWSGMQWQAVKTAVPFFPPANLCRKLKVSISLRRSFWGELLSYTPVMRWSTAEV